MAYSQQIAEGLRRLFEQLSIKARFEDKDSIGLFTIEMKLHGKLNTARMLVLVRENNFSTLTTCPIRADENSRLAAAEFLTRANYNMRNGNFELSMEDGEIRFKTYLHASDGVIDVEGARLAILMPFLMFDRYGDGLLEVVFGFKSPREAMEDIEQK